ncbi:MAG: PAS domain-containing sensor histidine kinase [Nocardioides sp.]
MEPPGDSGHANPDLVGQVVDYAIIALDQYGTVQSWNTGAERLTGYAADEVIGRHFSMFHSEQDQASGLPRRLLEQARDRGRVEHDGLRVRKDGTTFWANVVLTAHTDAGGRLDGFVKVTCDRTEQHHLEVSLRESEERFRVLVGQVVDYSIMALDPYGTIQSWNAGAERLEGYSAEEAMGRHFSMFYTEEDRASGLPGTLLDEALTMGRVEHTTWRVRKDGTTFWGNEVVTALHDPDGRHTGFATVIRDLSESKRIEQAQNSFFAAFNHDFRAPVTALKGFAELLRTAGDVQREVLIDRLERNADRLLDMTQQLINYAQLRSSASDLEPEPLAVTELVRETVADMESVIDTSRISVEDTADAVLADRGSMERVLGNLLGNAVKYSPQGPITIGAETHGDRVQIAVSDHGRGIAPEDLEVIFNEFERGRLAKADGGTGLGLASVKSIVTQQHGRVWIDSTVGLGTTVTVELPAAHPRKTRESVE